MTGVYGGLGDGVSGGSGYNCIVCCNDCSGDDVSDNCLMGVMAGGCNYIDSTQPASGSIIDMGTNAYAYGVTDLAGNPRVVNGKVDIGAYEHQILVSIAVVANPPASGMVTGWGTYLTGQTAPLVATPATNYYFVSWQDGDTHTNRLVWVVSNATYTATFSTNVPLSGFALWAFNHGVTGSVEQAFAGDSNCNNIPDGMEYAIGANYVPSEPMLNLFFKNGQPIIDAPRQDAATLADSELSVIGTIDLLASVWTLGLSPTNAVPAPPANRQWWLVDGAALSNAFFRLRAVQKP